MSSRNRAGGKGIRRQNSFSLIELLVVMAIIAVLAALTIGAATGVMQHAARSRATSEIAAMRTGLDAYKVDNGGYPNSDGVLLTNTYASYDGSSTEYQTNSEILFQALSGRTNYTDTTGGKSYISFRANQVGSGAGGSYVMDPWGLSYGYSSGSSIGAANYTPPYNGSNSYDLWSTGGVTYSRWSTNNALTNAWINNWLQ